MTSKTRALLLTLIGLAGAVLLLLMDIADGGFSINDLAVPMLLAVAVIVPSLREYVRAKKQKK